jgi:hypothetical protein
MMVENKKKTLIMRRASSAANRAIEPFLYLLESASADLRRLLISPLQREQSSKKFPNLILQLSMYYRMYAFTMHIIKPLRRKKKIYWVTLKVVVGEKGAAEERRRWGQLTVTAHSTYTFIICYGRTSLIRIANVWKWESILLTSISNSYVGIYGHRIWDC